MFVLHAVWTRNALHLWAESEEAASAAFASQPTVPSIEIEDNDLMTEQVDATSSEVIDETGEAEETTATAVVVEAKVEPHTYTLSGEHLLKHLVDAGILGADDVQDLGEARMCLPHRRVGTQLVPEPSERLASRMRWSLDAEGLQLEPVEVKTVPVKNERVAGVYVTHSFR